jgi:rhamnose utilization protein RhaD (predicted bifunctional aldolase and dehydrogenase)
MTTAAVEGLLKLSHEIGRDERGLAILGEGNVSARASDETYLVKASGTCLGSLGEEDVVECALAPVISLLDRHDMTDGQIREALLGARIEKNAKMPSVEAMFHALLLSLPDIAFVAHAHPVAVNQILCSSRAQEFAKNRLFPDEIVCCGVASVYVPLIDPGLQLAKAIRIATNEFVQEHQQIPRIVLMQNHGAIALGSTWQIVCNAMLMLEKAAQVFVGAATLGGPVFLSKNDVARIAERPDELYRQRLLAGTSTP